MRFISRLALLSLTLSVVASPGLAQKKLCPVPPPSPFKHSGQIVTSFDSSARRMRTTLEHPRVLGKGTDAIYLSASFTHQDPRRPSTPTVEVAFISSSTALKYRDTHNLVFFCDGKMRPVAGAARYQSRSGGAGTILEATRVTLTYDDLMTLTRSHKVAARLGMTEFELTNNHLEALRELASLMAPSPGRWRADE
ncbi:MAG TPA: hypothetical protein VM934_03815 [Pyrinomonadaceae bacterium]|jgi:hypothetical protein|nr:hypothetical protein [Pyrinomonadaceae bacterium]